MGYNLAEKQGFVLGLILGCPFQYSLADCPTISLKEISLEDQTKAVKEMTEDTLSEIIMHHRECSTKRIN